MKSRASRPEAGRRDLHYPSSDGLRLHVAEYGDAISPWLPVVCLPGLSRNARDFHDLAVHLSTHRHRPRRVLAFDLRGRGGSEWDKDVAHYTPLVEMQDVLDGMAALGVDRAVVVGTSRGGIIAMLMAVARPSVLAGVVLNDIGPAIEPRGLARHQDLHRPDPGARRLGRCRPHPPPPPRRPVHRARPTRTGSPSPG